MKLQLEKLKELIPNSNEHKLLSYIKSPDSLYDYIKSGRDFNDYVRDFEYGSILKGKIVSDDIDDYLVVMVGFEDICLVDLETSNSVRHTNNESTILDHYYVKADNLTDYYADKVVPNSIENIKDRYNQAIYRLTDENKGLEEQLDWADKQLDTLTGIVDELEDYIHELNEKIIRLIKEG